MTTTSTVSTWQMRRWPEERNASIPAWIYSDPSLFSREMEVFQTGATWNFIGATVNLAGEHGRASAGSHRRSKRDCTDKRKRDRTD